MVRTLDISQEILAAAQRVIPGGVSSANRRVEPNLTFTSANSAYIHDADGKQYIDYHAAFGPKAIANGFPLALLCERADLMARCGPDGDVFSPAPSTRTRWRSRRASRRSKSSSALEATTTSSVWGNGCGGA